MIEYSFVVAKPRPSAPPHPRARHTAAVDAVLGTEKTGDAVEVTAPDSAAAERLAHVIRGAVAKAIKARGLKVRPIFRVDGQTIAAWVVSTVPQAATTSPAPVQAPQDETEKRVVAALRKFPDGLTTLGIEQALYGTNNRLSHAERHAVATAISNLSRRKVLMQDGGLRYTLVA